MITFDAHPFGDHSETSPWITFILTRSETNKYKLLFGRAYGMAETREWAVLNSSTPGADPLVLSTENRPCIWIDSDFDRDARNIGPRGGTVAVLMTCDPPVFKVTGRTKQMYATEGGWREAQEVEILLKEEELAHSCYYCGRTEYPIEDHYEKCAGENYSSFYWCPEVSFYGSRILTNRM
jgi:hypothetical protein